MPLDAFCLTAVRNELCGLLTGAKIDKVQQPERDVLIFSVRSPAGSYRLLISAGTGDARVHLTEYKLENPASPPMFCMLLRKHLTSARITGIKQPQSERVLEFELETTDALGVISFKRLIVELIGRISNIILVDADGIIIDCMRRIGGELSDKRITLPGLLYRLPAAQEGKLDPLSVTSGKWQELFDTALSNEGGKSAEAWLMSAYTALPPLICRELAWRAYSETNIRLQDINDGGAALRDEFFKLARLVKDGRFEPWMVLGEDDSPRDFSYIRIMQYENVMSISRQESFSLMLDDFYTKASQRERLRQRASEITKAVKTARDRILRKLISQQEELKKTAGREHLRECGDLIMANLLKMQAGQRLLSAQDYYSETGGVREIPLDPRKNPQQNAAKYYKDYTKAKNAEKYLTEQIKIGQTEAMYLSSVLDEITLAEGESDLTEIRAELVQTGYIKARKQGKVKPVESAPMSFVSSTGVHITAGRNNAQNDKLTLKTAAKSDVWLHAQKVHGAHVIISCGEKEPDETTLYEAAAIAAYYSAARNGGKTPVDHTFVRYVKKPAGAKPGFVNYTDYKTIVATPDEKLVIKLRRM